MVRIFFEFFFGTTVVEEARSEKERRRDLFRKAFVNETLILPILTMYEAA